MKRILVPLDGSEFAERALQPAVSLATRLAARVDIVSVVTDLPPVPLASGNEEAMTHWLDEEVQRAERYLLAVRERLQSRSGTGPISTHVRVGPVTRSIEQVSRELDCDLIMLTTHGRGAWQRAWLGSVADQLLRRSATPLLLLRESGGAASLFEDPGSPRHVLVPLDGSEAAEAVLETIESILPEGARLTLASVLHQPFPLATTYLPPATTDESLLAERKVRTERYLDGVESRLRERGVPGVEVRIVMADDAAQGLLELADELKVDLIGLSTRGRGGVARFFMGSVSDKLVRGSKVPLLTVRRPSGDDEEEIGS